MIIYYLVCYTFSKLFCILKLLIYFVVQTYYSNEFANKFNKMRWKNKYRIQLMKSIICKKCQVDMSFAASNHRDYAV